MKRFLALGAVVALTAACQPPGPSTTVQRINPNAQVDMSGNWNDTDANQVARAMIQDCLSRPWATSFKAEKGRLPVVRLWPIKNRSSEHINWRFFTKQVEMELINSGMVKVVADLEEAQDNRDERADQARHASDKTVKAQQQETGSDFVLNGWVITQNDALEGQEVRAYVTTMELSNSESNEKVWMKVHPIKKVVSRAASQW
jgi:penicillin-binding protein activator